MPTSAASRPVASGPDLDRAGLVAWYVKNRARSRALFDLLADEAYYEQPIALRHPLVFYDGHLPAFSFNTLVKAGLGGASIDPRLETLFARGIDPHETASHPARGHAWPARDVMRRFTEEADARVLDALRTADLVRPGHPLLDRGEAVFTILEHEAMHQETLLYLWHRLPYAHKRRPPGYTPVTSDAVPASEWITIPPGRATLGVDRERVPFAWDNECPHTVAEVGAFTIARHDVTNADYLDFVESGGYADARWWTPEDLEWLRREGITHPAFWAREAGVWWWRGLFEAVPLPLGWPAYVSHAEATAYARWRGLRLPTEAEYQRAAYGTPSGNERRYPWGDAALHAAVAFDFATWDPHPCGSHPSGRSAWGVDDLVGNGWEWTGTVFGPFPGFVPLASYPQYSADFFDGEHRVMKGASTATAHELVRPSFRNWFRSRYPYVYASFRCVRARP